MLGGSLSHNVAQATSPVPWGTSPLCPSGKNQVLDLNATSKYLIEIPNTTLTGHPKGTGAIAFHPYPLPRIKNRVAVLHHAQLLAVIQTNTDFQAIFAAQSFFRAVASRRASQSQVLERVASRSLCASLTYSSR